MPEEERYYASILVESNPGAAAGKITGPLRDRLRFILPLHKLDGRFVVEICGSAETLYATREFVRREKIGLFAFNGKPPPEPPAPPPDDEDATTNDPSSPPEQEDPESPDT